MGLVSTHRGEGRSPGDLGIPACPVSALTERVSHRRPPCWLDAPNGRWRILGHESVHGAVVVHVEAAQLRDCGGDRQRFVDDAGGAIFQILVYVTAGRRCTSRRDARPLVAPAGGSTRSIRGPAS